jgi:uncharacterized protein YggE
MQSVRKTIMVMCCVSAATLMMPPLLATPGSMSQVDSRKGEVLLEVQATGINKQKATKFIASCSLEGKGKTEAAATADLAKKTDDLVQRLKARGIDRAAIDFYDQPSLTMKEDYGEGDSYAVKTTSASDAVKAAVERAVTGPEKVFSLAQFLPITTTSVKAYNDANFAISQSACTGNDYSYMRYPRFGSAMDIDDRPGAQRAAKNLALADARAQADAYAAAMGLKVLRLVRISESSALKEILGPEANIYQELWNEWRGARGVVSDEVAVSVSIWADYVLGPK